MFECWTSQGEEAVLKLAPTRQETALEAAALTVWRDSGASVQLLGADAAAGALLLRRVRPATPLPPDEHEAMDVAIDLLPRLHGASYDVVFPTLAELYPFLAQHSVDDLEYERRTRREPDRAVVALELLPAANAATDALFASSDATVLVHGDFIDKNILLHGDRYVSSDPIPRTGDPASDIGFFAHDHPPATGMLQRARSIAAATGNDTVRAQRWTAVWTVLLAISAWRPDQHDLEELITTREFSELLDT